MATLPHTSKPIGFNGTTRILHAKVAMSIVCLHAKVTCRRHEGWIETSIVHLYFRINLAWNMLHVLEHCPGH